eukprot:4685012-Pyramimonas_sp.AAC.1
MARRRAAPAAQHLRRDGVSGANANDGWPAPPRTEPEIGTTLSRSKSWQRSSGGNDDGDVSVEHIAAARSDVESGPRG